MKNRHRETYYDVDDGDEIIPPGGSVRVPMFLMDQMDADQREVVRDHFVRDALAAHYRYSANKPGFVQDALRQGGGQAMKDASYDLHERRGVFLEEAFRLRDAAFAEIEHRGAWRMKTDGKSAAPDNDDPAAADDNDNDVEIDDLEAAKAARGANAWKLSPGRATQIEQERQRVSAERPWTGSGL